MSWPTVKLCEASIRIGGGTPSREEKSYWGGKLSWFTVADLEDVDDIQNLSTSRECITREGLEHSAAKLIPKGAVVFSSRVVVGKVGIAGNNIATNQDFSSFVPIDGIDPEFLGYFLIKTKHDLRRHQRGATIKGVTTKILDAIDVPRPSIEEQRRIVSRIKECMERVEEIDSLRRGSKAEAALILRAYYYDLYRELLKRHAAFSLVEAGTVIGGGTPSRKQANYWKGDVPWISPKEMKQRDIFESSSCIIQEAVEKSSTKLITDPSVMFVVRGMILVHTLPVAVSRVPLTMNQDMKAIVPRKSLSVDFLAAMIRGAERDLLAQVEIAGHGTRRLQTDVWSSARIPALSDDEQASVIAEVQNMERMADALAANINSEGVGSLRESILRKAFAGGL